MSSPARCAYGRALVAATTGGAMPAGYEYLAGAEDLRLRLEVHDGRCRECAVADDSTHDDAGYLRRRRRALAALWQDDGDPGA